MRGCRCWGAGFCGRPATCRGGGGAAASSRPFILVSFPPPLRLPFCFLGAGPARGALQSGPSAGVGADPVSNVRCGWRAEAELQDQLPASQCQAFSSGPVELPALDQPRPALFSALGTLAGKEVLLLQSRSGESGSPTTCCRPPTQFQHSPETDFSPPPPICGDFPSSVSGGEL